MNFVKQGKGKKTLVFLHGWGGSWQSWAPIIERLKSKFVVYAVDLPGFGDSPLPKPYSLADYISDLKDLLVKEKINRPVLIGHSFGGQVAAKFAILYPEKISKLILVDAAVSRRNDARMKFNIKLARVGGEFIQMTPLGRFYPLLRKWYYQLRGWSGSDYCQAVSTPNLQATASMIFREDLMDQLSQIKTSTLLIWGQNDPDEITPLTIGRQVKEKISTAKLVIIPNAGHFSYLDNQKLFCQELEKFV
jgi:pimeloyl-ACP methyl ester carboxylesterase